MRLKCALAFTIGFSASALAQDVALSPLEVDPALAELGKRMFYDTRLSGDATLACASCHQPDKAFTDGEALSQAYTGAGHFRNAPTLANVGYREAWFHDGRQGTTLNDVTREMITETYLMNMDMRIMQERMKQDPVYVAMFQAAGMNEPSNGGARNAIQAFMQTIVSTGAPADSGSMSAAAIRG
ncbi:MAG: cytochrome-c peroxidase, partial [Pseudomonadota bacterium]